MKKNKKVVENYQIIETLQEYENEYEILLAKHISEKQFYIIKKLSIKEGNNQALYEGLLKEAALLKKLDHQNIVKCHRMLKTSNNIYLVFTYFEGKTLEEMIQEGPKNKTFAQKEAIAKQLVLILSEFNKNQVAHLNITPQNILISSNNSIMVREFIYGMEIPQEGEIQIKRKVPKSEYTAPQVRKGIASHEADIYSVGKILKKMQFKKCKKDPKTSVDNSKRLDQILDLIASMTEKERANRITINQVYQLFASKKKIKRLRSMNSMSQSNLLQSRVSSTSSFMSASKSQFGSKKIYKDILLKIMRHRNMSWFLVKLFHRVAVDIKLSRILLLKKSTKSLAGLGKYLHYGKNDIDIDITIKEQTKFFKTADYHKICQIVDKEIIMQKKELEGAIQTVYMNNSVLLKKAEFNRQIRDQQISEDYFEKCIKDYLIQTVVNQKQLNLSDDVTIDLYLMSYIIKFKGVEQMFRQRILYDPPNLYDQILMKKARQTSCIKLIEQIRQNIQNIQANTSTSTKEI